jgi:hypothetical protein
LTAQRAAKLVRRTFPGICARDPGGRGIRADFGGFTYQELPEPETWCIMES